MANMVWKIYSSDLHKFPWLGKPYMLKKATTESFSDKLEQQIICQTKLTDLLDIKKWKNSETN